MARVFHLLSGGNENLVFAFDKAQKLRIMTASMIIQTIVALGIVAVALVYVLRRVIKTTRGKDDCGCGCGKNCPHHSKSIKEYKS